jgi:Cd2+/Zn2+-exporting ATPase
MMDDLKELEITAAEAAQHDRPEPEEEEEEDEGLDRLEVVFTVVCGVTLLSGWLGGLLGIISPQVQLGLYITSYISGGYFGLWEGIKSLRKLEINVDFLMVLAAIGAASIGQWAEGATLLFLFSLSNTLQSYAMDRSRRAIRALMDLRPPEALVRRPDGREELVPVEDLQVGDLVIVKPGERLPIDGAVVAGHSTIDQSAITGESMPVEKGIGDDVFAGTVNGNGAIELTVSRLATDTTLAKIIKMVEEAQGRKAPTQRFLDEFEPKYAMGVIIGTLLMIVVPYFILRQPWDNVFYRAMTLLVVASPCALVISTPASILAAIANAARNGILFKGGAYLEQAATISAIAFDKTGTLTTGKPVVTDVIPAADLLGDAWFEADYFAQLQPKGVDTPVRCSSDTLLCVAASAERHSEHPLAAAIVAQADRQSLPVKPVENLQAITGQGIVATLDGQEVRVGNQRLLDAEQQIWPAPLQARARHLEADGKTVVFISQDNHPLGMLALADVIRDEAPAALAALRDSGVKRMVMITGDTRRVAEAVARQLGIVEVYAELLPEQKVEIIEKLAEQGNVAMLGDGVNDAPAMAVSSLGIAMGGAGTDVALETADVALMADDLSKLPYVIDLARRARRVVWQNIAFSLTVIVVLILSTLFFTLPLTLGVVGHEGSTLLVVANGLRLLRTPGQPRPKAARSAAPMPVGAP